jgi:glutamate synthase (NADPH/NADH) large chain
MTGGTVVVLGGTGRNFAAGMSGGIAYVLDLDGDRLNTELVDPKKLTEADRDQLRALIIRHQEETGSEIAGRLLDDWGMAAMRFTKVLPRDYARVLAAREQAEAEGLDETTTTSRMMEAANG